MHNAAASVEPICGTYLWNLSVEPICGMHDTVLNCVTETITDMEVTLCLIAQSDIPT